MSTRTVRDLIDAALGMLGVKSIGATISNEDANLGFDVFQDLIAGLLADKMLINFETEDSFPMVAGQAYYTIGPAAADITTVRPESIITAFSRAGSTDYPITPITNAEYNKLPIKSTGGRPFYLYYNPTATNGSIYLYPTPNNTDTVYLISYKTYTEPTDLTDIMSTDLSIPREYYETMKYMMAEKLMPYFDVEKPYIIIKAEVLVEKMRNINLARRIKPVGMEEVASVDRRRIYDHGRFPY